MKNLLKAAGVLLAFLVLLLGAGALLIERLLPPEKVRDIAVREARKALGRDVSLEEIKIGLVFGLRLKGVDVKGLASARQLTLRPSWRALLRRELDIQSVTIDGLRLTVPKTAPAAPAPTAAAAPAAAASAFAVRKVVVRDAELTGEGWQVRKLDAEAWDLKPDAPFRAKASFELRQRAVAVEGTVDPAKRTADLEVSLPGLLAGRLSGGEKAVDFDLRTETLTAAELAELGASSPVDLPPTRAKGRVELGPAGPSFPELTLTSEWGTVVGRGDLKRAEAVLKLSLPALKGLPPLKLDGQARLEGDDVKLGGLAVGTPWGPVTVDALLRGARKAQLRPEGSASFDLDLPAFKTSELRLPGAPPGYEVPAAKLSGKVTGTLERARLEGVRLRLGGTDLSAEGWASKERLDLTLKCRSFVLEELTPIAPATRELKLKGRGLFALVVNGPPAKPLLAGKLQFTGLGAEVAGLALAGFGGTASFDERRLDVPNLRGTLDGSPLSVDLTVRDYAKAPAVELQAELDRLDLAKLLAAKQARAAAAPAPAAPAGPAAPATPLKAKGRLLIKELVHPNASAESARLAWDLEGLAPGLKELSGWAKMSAGPGRLRDLGIIGTQSPVLKVVLLPLTIIQRIAGLLGRSLLPDLNNIDFQEVSGDYAFERGLMRVNDSRLHSNDVFVESKGSINLPTEALDLVVTAQVGRVNPIEIGVTGTISSPKAKPKIGKFLAEPAKQLIENIFRPR